MGTKHIFYNFLLISIFWNNLGLSAKDNAVPKLTEAMSRIAAVSADVQASLNEIKDILDSEEEQQNEYEAIIGRVDKYLLIFGFQGSLNFKDSR